ncbi:MAG TPA: DNA repair protein RadC [Clostridiales bacterium]|jgi:DNA repair protein RadC|nr:DNA repair protein RadC [Clostridiales bacterium]
MGIHDGHRERMKKRFLQYGLDNFDDHNVLELLLFYALPRRDLNPLAHNLLNHFGSLSGVLEASIEDLKRVPGMGENAAILLKLVPQVSRRYLISKNSDYDILDSVTKAGQYLMPLFMYERDEVVYMICLDAKRKVISCREISRGVVNTAEVSIRKIVEFALANNATSVIISHNHTSGIALPSYEDEMTTLQIKAALEMVGITLADHIIVAGDDYVSLAESGLLESR